MTASPTGARSLVFDFDTFPTETQIQNGCTKEHIKRTCALVGANVGKNKSEAYGNLRKYIAYGSKTTKSGGFVSKGVTKSTLIQEAQSLGIERGWKLTGKQAGKHMLVHELNTAELEAEIAKAQFAAAATAAATAAAMKVVVDNSDEESEDAAVEAEEDAEEEVQDDCDEVIYLAHL